MSVDCEDMYKFRRPAAGENFCSMQNLKQRGPILLITRNRMFMAALRRFIFKARVRDVILKSSAG